MRRVEKTHGHNVEKEASFGSISRLERRLTVEAIPQQL